MKINEHIISTNISIRETLKKLDQLSGDGVLFIIDKSEKLIGSITDGDVRRGLISGLNLDNPILDFATKNPKYLEEHNYDPDLITLYRNNKYQIIPILNKEQQIVDILNFNKQRSYLPLQAVIMAGGKGTRLRPMTLTTPKPLLKIGGKPIIEYNIDRLRSFGIKNLNISINYLGEQLIDTFEDGKDKDMIISYITENQPLGTIGAVKKIKKVTNEYILVMNSDILSNIDYERMFNTFYKNNADIIVATTSYQVDIPYGIIETDKDQITGLKEKPTYTYYSNAGIYIFKKELISLIPDNLKFNATDFLEVAIAASKNVMHYNILNYWLDIGKPNDFTKAQQDIKNIKF